MEHVDIHTHLHTYSKCGMCW